MRLFGVQKEAPREQAELARLRVAAMGKRSGWVPKVPTRVANPAAGGQVRDPTATAWRARAVGPLTTDRVIGETGRVEADRGDAGTRGASSRKAGRLELGGGQSGEDEPGRHRSAASAAVADWLPLPLRAVVESLPSGVRRGEVGLQRGQALVVVLVILLGLAVAALLTGLGRPRVAPVDPAAISTVAATGTPAPDAEAPGAEAPGDAPDGQSDGAEAPGDAPDGQSDRGARPAHDGAELVIHVAGKVANPGVVELPSGSRVLDAIEAAGGADAGVDLTPLNLARLLTDGEQVAVGIEPAPDAAPADGPAAPGPGGLINLNTATADQLETLPGIGPILAGQILLWREQNGRFTAIEELQEVSGIGPKKFAALADQVTV